MTTLRMLSLGLPHRPSGRPIRFPTCLLALLLLGACSDSPDSRMVEALTSGLWHAQIDGDDYLYEFNSENGSLVGCVHRVGNGRQINEVSVSRVSVRNASIEFRHRGFPSYRGVVDWAAGRIEGGIPGDSGFLNMNLTRVEAENWPMIRPRSEGTSAPTPYLWRRPDDSDDGWPTGAPSEVGITQTAVDETVQAILRGEAAALHSLLLVRDGKLVLEEYFYGWSRDELHHIASCTKSVSSLLLGIAVDRGLVVDTSVPLLDFFPERLKGTGSGWNEIQLEHLLTMTMGLDWAEHQLHGWPPLGDQIGAILERDREEEPGSRFRYTNRNVNLLASIFLRSSGSEADLFAAEHLFSPLGITDWNWDFRRWQGHPDMAAALRLRPRDMAKLGQLVLQDGVWDKEQVVSREWIHESTRSHVPETPYDLEYGLLWWRLSSSDSPLGTITFANGMGTQFIAVIPDARLVMVTTGGNDHNGRQFDIVQVAERYLLPGIG